jgi:hypothetical protein
MLLTTYEIRRAGARVESGAALEAMCKRFVEQSKNHPNAKWELVRIGGLVQETEILRLWPTFVRTSARNSHDPDKR